MSQITGAEIVFKAFVDHGVEYIFGYPGGSQRRLSGGDTADELCADEPRRHGRV